MRDFNLEDKCYVRFSISNYGKTHEFSGEFEDCVVWPEVLHEIVKTLEASYGYSFDIDVDTPQGSMGVYHASKP